MQIEIACDLLFAGAGLAVDEYRLAQQGEGAYLGRLGTHRAAEAVETVGEEVFALALVQGAQAGTAGMERDAGRNTVEQTPLDVVHQQLLGGDAVELVPIGVVKAEVAAGRDLPDVGLKQNVLKLVVLVEYLGIMTISKVIMTKMIIIVFILI